MKEETTAQDIYEISSGRTTIPVHVRDAAGATAFYRSVFEAQADIDDQHILYLDEAREFAIRIIAVDALAAPVDSRPVRCELVVDNVDERIHRAVERGAQIRTRLMASSDRTEYVQLIDPFGYRWSLTAQLDHNDQEP